MRIEDPDNITVAPDGRPPAAQPLWRREFSIDWPQDELRSRRQFINLLALTSLAFVAGQAWIVALSFLRKARGQPPLLDIAAVDDVPVGGVRLFHYPGKDDACVLVRASADRFLAYGQKCTHLSCPVIPKPAEGRFYCPCHEGSFDLNTGQPLAGQPRRPLPRVTVEIRRGRIVATGIEEGQA
jgi:Rieske Fe-S protein